MLYGFIREHECLQLNQYTERLSSKGVTQIIKHKYWKKIWSLKIHERLKIMFWKVMWDLLPTKAKITNRVGLFDEDLMTCALYDVEKETTHHLVF